MRTMAKYGRGVRSFGYVEMSFVLTY